MQSTSSAYTTATAQTTTRASSPSHVPPSSSSSSGASSPAPPAPPATTAPHTVRRIPPESTAPIRHAVLWPSIPLEDQLLPYDHLETTWHYGVFVNDVGDSSELSSELSGRLAGAESGVEVGIEAERRLAEGRGGRGVQERANSSDSAPVGVLTLTRQDFAHPLRLPNHIRTALYVHSFEDESPSTSLPQPLAPQSSPSPSPSPSPSHYCSPEYARTQTAQIQMHKFAILPSHQRLGLGRALLEHAQRHTLDTARADGVRTALLHFDARTSQQGLYEHTGFAVLDEERFCKFGSTGKGPGVEYVRMGRLFTLDA